MRVENASGLLRVGGAGAGGVRPVVRLGRFGDLAAQLLDLRALVRTHLLLRQATLRIIVHAEGGLWPTDAVGGSRVPVVEQLVGRSSVLLTASTAFALHWIQRVVRALGHLVMWHNCASVVLLLG